MSKPPPGYETPHASPPLSPPAPQAATSTDGDTKARSERRTAGDNAQYELKSVQVLRGRESSATARWHNQGWEFISENRGTLRTELNFRREKPKTLGAHLLGIVAALRRLQPKTQSALVAGCALVLLGGVIGTVLGTGGEGQSPKRSAAQPVAPAAPPAEPTVAGIADDELLEDAEAIETSKPDERRAKARARARARTRARVERRETALRRERRRNTRRLQSGVTCAELGETDVRVSPGADIDADGDGVGCES